VKWVHAVDTRHGGGGHQQSWVCTTLLPLQSCRSLEVYFYGNLRSLIKDACLRMAARTARSSVFAAALNPAVFASNLPSTYLPGTTWSICGRESQRLWSSHEKRRCPK